VSTAKEFENKLKKLTKPALIEQVIKVTVQRDVAQSKLEKLRSQSTTQDYLKLADDMAKVNKENQRLSERLSRHERFTPRQNVVIDWCGVLLMFAGIQVPLLLFLKWALN